MAPEPNGSAHSDDRYAAVAVRGNASLALAKAFSRPDQWPPDIDDLLLHGFSGTGNGMADLVAQMAESISDTSALSASHARLFLGPFAVQAAPWASFYLDSEQQLMGPVSQYAAEAYAAAGLGPSSGSSGGHGEPPDHVTLELEFMYFLAFQEATTGEQEWLERQQRFWREHLALWLPDLADALGQAAKDSRFYSLLSTLTREFCRWQGGQLGSGGSTGAPLSDVS